MATKKSKKSADTPGDLNTPGAVLRSARDAAGMSVDEVAHELHLSREVVLSLEENDHAALGAPVFVRGHLRNYARLLGVPVEAVVEQLPATEPEPEEFRTLSTATEVKPAASLSNFVLLILLGIILLVAAGYLLLDEDPESSTTSDFETTPEVVVEVQEKLEDFEPVALLDEEDLSEALDEPEADPEAENQAFTDVSVESIPEVIPESAPVANELVKINREESLQITTTVTPEAETVELRLRFSEECWVEIADAQRRLLYGLEKPGQDVIFNGVPPFRFFLGNAAAVEIAIAGEAYPVPRSARGGKTARFTIAAGTEN